ncbi:lipid A deacylase LpxR family protein [Parapedobacter tibetensis]|uniref:lipid A deacylase LpxR family protein n=1 Tax=Parapedobacter tibetensis TaxID=2972951 RepID=UPI00214D4042|nr:lipid A deacylase LpxR family protein [Parapedobacter tibetensis]
MPNHLYNKNSGFARMPAGRKSISTGILLIAFVSCLAQKMPRLEIHFQNDNDLYLFNRQDQYYTNGLFFNIRKTVDSTALAPKETNRLWGITMGQKMYNAYTAQIHRIEEVDRPITAYLFLAANVDRYFANETFLSFTAEIGTIGQRALGRQFQESIHRVLRLYEIAGWEYQLENAFGLDASIRYGGLLYRNKRQWFDISAYTEATLGSNHTSLAASPTFRWGKINPLHQSAHWSGRLQSRNMAVKRELFAYFRPQLNLVIYDATIQGGLFRRDKGPVTYEPSRWVLSNHFGVTYARNSLTLNMQYIFNTKELPGMFFRHQYGSLGLSYRY